MPATRKKRRKKKKLTRDQIAFMLDRLKPLLERDREQHAIDEARRAEQDKARGRQYRKFLLDLERKRARRRII